MRAPEIIAHRGLTTRHRENTLAAFRAAADLGVDGIELDVHATADQVVVVHHDADAQTSTGARLAIVSATFDQLRAAATDAIPRLSDVLEAVGEHTTVYVEIKAPRIEQLVCEAIRPAATRCAVHAFDHRSIARCREIAPEVPRGVLMASYLIDPVAPLRDTAARDLWQHWDLIDEPLVARVHAAGGRVIAWTVNSVPAMLELTTLGVDGICTDKSADAVEALRP